MNAWQLPAGTFVQALGACGLIYLAKLNDDGSDGGGGVYIVDVETREAAQAFIEADPFYTAELFAAAGALADDAVDPRAQDQARRRQEARRKRERLSALNFSSQIGTDGRHASGPEVAVL